jgi:tRNA(Arg) A34 adenosine deaminase TadA
MIIAQDVPGVGSGKHAACIVFKKQIVSIGVNSKKTTTLMSFFNRRPEAIVVHAEIAAIHSALKRMSYSNLKKSTLYIARAKTVGGIVQPGLSMPCSGCARALEHFGISRVVYTVNNQ